MSVSVHVCLVKCVNSCCGGDLLDGEGQPNFLSPLYCLHTRLHTRLYIASTLSDNLCCLVIYVIGLPLYRLYVVGQQGAIQSPPWQEDWTSNPFARSKYIKGKIVYQKHPQVRLPTRLPTGQAGVGGG